MPLTPHVVRSLVRFCLKCLTDNAAFGAIDAYFWRKTGYLEHKSIAEELSRRPRGYCPGNQKWAASELT